MPKRQLQPSKHVMDVLAQASREHGIPFDTFRRFAEIESTFRPGAKTGKYSGLFMLSREEFKRGGGRGSIMNPEANTNAFANILKKNISAFENAMGRKPSGWETYLVHQQGVAGGPEHLKNPDKPAWVNMYNTPEGQRRGKAWSKLAIKGNIPKKTFKTKFGGDVNRVTSGEFTSLWRARFARAGGGADEPAFDPSPAGSPDLPERGMRVAEQRPKWMDTDQNVVMVGGGDEAPPTPERRDAGVGTPEHRPKYTYRAPEYAEASPGNEVPAAPPRMKDFLTPAATSSQRARRSAMLSPAGTPKDEGAERTFGAPFGELYARPDQGSTLLKDVLPRRGGSFDKFISDVNNPGGAGVDTIGSMPAKPPMFREFFLGLFR